MKGDPFKLLKKSQLRLSRNEKSSTPLWVSNLKRNIKFILINKVINYAIATGRIIVPIDYTRLISFILSLFCLVEGKISIGLLLFFWI